MKKIIYIIPGLGENCNEVRYKKLRIALHNQGYKVYEVNPDWFRPLSEQIFFVPKNAIVCGFSFGAVLAYLIAKKYHYRKAVFASISPIHKFSYKILEKDLLKYMKKEQSIAIVKDIKKIKISMKSLAIPYIRLAGELEKDMPADIIVPNTGHRITKEYTTCIQNLV